MQGAMRVACKINEKIIGFYEINSFPGCPQIAVSNQAFIDLRYRRQGYGSYFHSQRLRQMKELGFNYVTCTVVETNIPQIKILEKFQWKKLDRIFNTQSEHWILLYGRSL